MLSVFGARPGAGDMTTFGSPAEFTYCMAEAVDVSPWPSLADEIGDGSPGVLAVKCEGPRNILEGLATNPRGICEALAATACGLGANNSYVPGDFAGHDQSRTRTCLQMRAGRARISRAARSSSRSQIASRRQGVGPHSSQDIHERAEGVSRNPHGQRRAHRRRRGTWTAIDGRDSLGVLARSVAPARQGVVLSWISSSFRTRAAQITHAPHLRRVLGLRAEEVQASGDFVGCNINRLAVGAARASRSSKNTAAPAVV